MFPKMSYKCMYYTNSSVKDMNAIVSYTHAAMYVCAALQL